LKDISYTLEYNFPYFKGRIEGISFGRLDYEDGITNYQPLKDGYTLMVQMVLLSGKENSMEI
jgi:hypothetical protein